MGKERVRVLLNCHHLKRLGEKNQKKELLAKSWRYLNDNFHKFTQANKIKIALTLCTKDTPNQMEHYGEVILTKEDKFERIGRLRELGIPKGETTSKQVDFKARRG